MRRGGHTEKGGYTRTQDNKRVDQSKELPYFISMNFCGILNDAVFVTKPKKNVVLEVEKKTRFPPPN